MEPLYVTHEEECHAREQAEYEDYLDGFRVKHMEDDETPMAIEEWRAWLQSEANRRLGEAIAEASNNPQSAEDDDIPF